MTRKGFIAGAAGIAAALAVGTASAGEGQVNGQLGAIANQLSAAASHLERVANEITPCVAPDPKGADALRRIRNDAQDMIVIADELLGRVPA